MSRVIKSHDVNMDYEQKINIQIPQIETKTNEEIKSEMPKVANVNSEELAQIKADRIIAEARAEAKKIIDDAYFEKEILFQETRKKAIEDLEAEKKGILEDAYNEGFNKGKQEAEHLKDEANEMLIGAKHTYDETLEQIEPEVVNLIIGICEKLIKKAMTIKPEIIKYLIDEGLSKTTLTGEIFIHVSTEDYEYTNSQKDEFIKADSKTKIEIINDQTLSKGDIIIETPFGNIDSSITNQFSELKEDLLYLLENR